MYIVFENVMSNVTLYFALTENQMKDEKSKVLFENGTCTEIARVKTVREMRALNTATQISYINNKGQIKFA